VSNAANNGLTISAAPPTPWYKNPCVTKAIAKGALSTGIDAIGLIPGGGAVSAELSLFHGAAAVSNGTAILGRVQLGAGIITAANGASNTSTGKNERAVSQGERVQFNAPNRELKVANNGFSGSPRSKLYIFTAN
jgi:hypothetical protein